MTIDGELSYLVMAQEATWGTVGTNKVHIPVTTYDVKQKNEKRQANLFSGIKQRKHSRNFRGMPTGSLVTDALSYWIDADGDATDETSILQFLMDWAFNDLDATYIDSMSAEWAEGPNTSNLRHLGLRVNQLTLAGDASSGITLSLDLMGKSEATFATAVVLPDDREKFAEFLFADTTLTVNSLATAYESFQLVLSRGLQAQYRNSSAPTYINSVGTDIQFSFTADKTADTYAAFHRAVTTDADLDIQLNLTGSHNGTGSSGTNTTALIDMPVCRLIEPDDQRGKGLVMHNVQCDALKPDTSEDAINFTYGVA